MTALTSSSKASIKLAAVKAGHKPSSWTDEQLAHFHATGEAPAAAARQPKAEQQAAAASKPEAAGSVEAAIKQLIEATASNTLDEDRVRAICAEYLQPRESLVSLEVTGATGGESKVTIKRAHKVLADVVFWLDCGQSVYLVGPAASGKTTIGQQAAAALNLPFYFSGAVKQEHKLLGYKDAGGTYHRTQFRDAFEHGGVFLFDEIDGSASEALLAFNAPLANGIADFPDGPVVKHPDFRAIAAANTFGKGADRVYVGRSQLDGATLDRFAIIEVDYDEALERELALEAARATVGAEELDGDQRVAVERWVDFVQGVRAKVFANGIRHVVSPRASIGGARAVVRGHCPTKTAEALVWKGLAQDAREQIAA